MNIVRGVDLIAQTNEEKLPGFTPEFPYIASRAELSGLQTSSVPWHWHKVAELFYMEKGAIEYETTQGIFRFEEGQWGLLMPNVLHKTIWDPKEEVVSLIHLFDPALLFGSMDGRMAQKYILPLGRRLQQKVFLSDSETDIAKKVRYAFELDEHDLKYEFNLREMLSEVWLYCLENTSKEVENSKKQAEVALLKQMMSYIQENCGGNINVENIAKSGNVSIRTCYRTFKEVLRMSPNDYIRSCRIQKACLLLTQTENSVTDIALECGFSSVGYFGKSFREDMGCSPSQFRKMA